MDLKKREVERRLKEGLYTPQEYAIVRARAGIPELELGRDLEKKALADPERLSDYLEAILSNCPSFNPAEFVIDKEFFDELYCLHRMYDLICREEYNINNDVEWIRKRIPDKSFFCYVTRDPEHDEARVRDAGIIFQYFPLTEMVHIHPYIFPLENPAYQQLREFFGKPSCVLSAEQQRENLIQHLMESMQEGTIANPAEIAVYEGIDALKFLENIIAYDQNQELEAQK